MSNDVVNEKAVLHGMELRLDRALNGVRTVLSSGGPLDVGGVPMTSADLDQKLSQGKGLHEGPRNLRLQLDNAIKARDADIENQRKLLEALQAAVANRYGVDSNVLVQFGFKPKRKKAKSSAAKSVVQQVKSEETRVKRGTLGKRQKAALKAGPVQSVTIGPDGKPVVAKS